MLPSDSRRNRALTSFQEEEEEKKIKISPLQPIWRGFGKAGTVQQAQAQLRENDKVFGRMNDALRSGSMMVGDSSNAARIAANNARPTAAQAAQERAAQVRTLASSGRLDQVAALPKRERPQLNALGKSFKAGIQDIGARQWLTESFYKSGQQQQADGVIRRQLPGREGGGAVSAERLQEQQARLKADVDRFAARDAAAAEAIAAVDTDAPGGKLTVNILAPLAQSAPSVAFDMLLGYGWAKLGLSAGKGIARVAGKGVYRTLLEQGPKAAAKTLAASMSGSLADAVSNPASLFRMINYFGDAYDGALEDGASTAQAVAAATLTAIPSVLIEASGGYDNVVKDIANGSFSTGVGQLIGRGLRTGWEEGREEALQGFVGDLAARLVYDPEARPLDLRARGQEALVGFTGGALMGSGAYGLGSAVRSGVSDGVRPVPAANSPVNTDAATAPVQTGAGLGATPAAQVSFARPSFSQSSPADMYHAAKAIRGNAAQLGIQLSMEEAWSIVYAEQQRKAANFKTQVEASTQASDDPALDAVRYARRWYAMRDSDPALADGSNWQAAATLRDRAAALGIDISEAEALTIAANRTAAGDAVAPADNKANVNSHKANGSIDVDLMAPKLASVLVSQAMEKGQPLEYRTALAMAYESIWELPGAYQQRNGAPRGQTVPVAAASGTASTPPAAAYDLAQADIGRLAQVYQAQAQEKGVTLEWSDAVAMARKTVGSTRVANRQTSAVLPGNVGTPGAAPSSQRAAVGPSDQPVRVGRATVIRSPYYGPVPQQRSLGVEVAVSNDAIAAAEQNIAIASADAQQTGASLRSILKKVYTQVFTDSGGQRDIAVTGLTMDGKQYLVRIDNSAVGKIVSGSHLSPEKLAVIDMLDDIVESGEYLGSGEYIAKADKPGKNVIRYDYFETQATIGSQAYTVTFDVEVIPGRNRYRTHRIINNIELTPTTDGEMGSLPIASSQQASAPIYSIAHSGGNDNGNFSGGGASSPSPAALGGQRRAGRSGDRTAADLRQELTDEARGEENGKEEPGLPGLAQESGARTARNMDDVDWEAQRPPDKAHKTLRQAAADGWDAFMRMAVSNGIAIEKLARKTGDEQLVAIYDNALNSNKRAEFSIGYLDEAGRVQGAQTNCQNQRVGRSLLEIFGEVKNDNAKYGSHTRYEWFNNYLLHMHNIDRCSQNKPIFGFDFEGGMTAQIAWSQGKAAEIGKRFPEFLPLAQEVWQFSANELQNEVDAGLISAEDMALMRQMYPHYVPVWREGEQQRRGRYSQSVKLSTGVKQATGGQEPIVRIETALARKCVGAWNNITGNQLAQRVVQNGYQLLSEEDASGTAPYAPDIDDADIPVFDNDGNLYIYINGERRRVAVDDSMAWAFRELLGKAGPNWEEKIGNEMVGFMDKVRGFNRLYKGLITGFNPIFTVKNAIRDPQDAAIYSKAPAKWMIQYPEAIRKMRENDADYQEYLGFGGSGSSYFEYAAGQSRSQGRGGIIGAFIDRVEATNILIEQAPRFAEYLATKGDSYESKLMAMYNAAEITTNFKRGGKAGKYLNATLVPFLNPSIQGFDKLARTLFEQKSAKAWAKLAARAVVFGVAPTLINSLLYKDDDEYALISQRDKDRYYLYKLGDGKWLKISKGRVVSVLGGTANRILFAMQGEDADLGGLLDLAKEQVAPASPFENNLFQPWARVQLLDEKKPGETWWGGNIENQQDQGNPEWMRYDSGTSEISKAVGKALGLSPKKLDNLIDSYTGVLGDVVLPLTSAAYKNNPLAANFTLDSIDKNKLSDQYYDVVGHYEKMAGDVGLSREDMAVGEATAKYLDRTTAAISDIYKNIEAIQASAKYTKPQKAELVRELQREINGLRAGVIATAQGYEAAARECYNSKLSEEELYISANAQALGYEYALQVYSKDVYKRAKKAEEEGGVGYDVFFDFYFDTKDFERIATANEEAEYSRREQTRDYLLSSLSNEAVRQYLWADAGYSGDINAYARAAEQLAGNRQYLALDVEERGKVLDKVSAWYGTPDNDPSKSVEPALAILAGWTAGEYYTMEAAMGDITAKDAYGRTVSGLKKERTIEYLQRAGLSEGQMWTYLLLTTTYKPTQAQRQAAGQYILDLDLAKDDLAWMAKEIGMRYRDGRLYLEASNG